MPNPLVGRLLPFARSLQNATTLRDVLERAHDEIREAIGFEHVWLFVFENEDDAYLLDLSAAPSVAEAARRDAARLTIRGDAMLEEIARAEAPVVVDDARTDPRVNREIVEKLQNRTIINIPLRLLDAPLGALGLGTFGDEGCRPPTPGELEYLIVVGSYVSIAAGRIRFLEERAQAEREKRALEHRVFQSQKLESLGVLAGGIAHDFNNLLTIVVASAGLLREAVSDPDSLADVDAILGAAHRGSTLRQLLALSRSSVLDLRPMDLNDRLRQLVVLLRRVLPESIEITVAEAADLPLIEADAGELDQLFMNLCINARDAMPDGGRLTLEISPVVLGEAFTETYPWARPGRYVLVAVTDTGSGMPPEVVEHIFEPFFTTKGERGTGLGLAVAYGIVRQHGGLLHVYSEPDVGTTFRVYLPAFSEPVTAAAPPVERPAPRGNERILVAEDDPSVRGVIERILRTGGYDVTGVENGEEALKRAGAEAFGLVILDTIMPRLSGPEALEAIRASRPETRFILSSGYLGAAKDAAARLLPRVRFLEKPYDPDGLLRTVRAALDD